MPRKLPPTNKKIPREKNFIPTPASQATIYINYSEKEKILEVEFILHGVYQYMKVPQGMWEEYKEVVSSGGSSGVFVNQQIKPHHDYREVTLLAGGANS